MRNSSVMSRYGVEIKITALNENIPQLETKRISLRHKICGSDNFSLFRNLPNYL